MMRLAFIHGMRQEGKDPAELRSAWEGALQATWAQLGLGPPAYDLHMPFYGDVLEELTVRARGAGRVVARGAMPGGVSADEQLLLEEYQRELGITDTEVQQEVSAEIVAKGPANWEWVQGIARAIERRVPRFGTIGLGFVRQVDAYLTRPHIRQAVDDIVRPALAGGRTVVVAHSLGTIVAYRLLRLAGPAAEVPLLMTLGSPLGIAVVKERIRPPDPLARPDGVARWVNGTDERDYVALHARLEAGNFAAEIENIADIRNSREDAHSITDYLSDPRVARNIFAALTE